MRALVPAGLSVLLLLAAPAVAAADYIFDPADADDLAATLAEATAQQDICYGWKVNVYDQVGTGGESIGSDRGAGVPVDISACEKYVRLDVSINYTSESSESEDYASYDLYSSSGGPTKADLDDLGLNWDGLTGEDPDVVIGNAVAALPLLAADAGMGKAIEAAPRTGTAPADASLTDNPGSDWWRNNGGTVLWGLGLLLAGGVFAWWVWRTNRRHRPAPYEVPDTVPEHLTTSTYEPPTAPIAVPRQKPPTRPVPVAKPEPAAKPEPGTAGSAQDRPDPSEEDVAPPGQKDKE